LLVEPVADVLLLAEVAPPEPPPPAASTLPVVAEALLSPVWPVAVASPVEEVAWPSLVRTLTLARVSVMLELPPLIDPPLARLPL